MRAREESGKNKNSGMGPTSHGEKRERARMTRGRVGPSSARGSVLSFLFVVFLFFFSK